MESNEPTIEVRQFLGLRNTDRPARLPLGALVDATNINIDDSGGIERRVGYTAITGLTAVTAAYSTRNELDLYVVDNGILKRVLRIAPLTTQAIITGVPAGEVWWSEDGGYVFCSGALNGIIKGDTFTPYADFGSDDDMLLDAQGQELATDEADIGTLGPPDSTECVAFFEGSVWLSYYDPATDQSFIFKSKPFFWSRWDLETDYIAVPGHVVMLASTSTGVVVGTDKEIWVYAQDVFNRITDYGVIPCEPAEDSGRVYFWTERGLCRALPFEAMTEEGVSVPHGTRARIVVSRDKGSKIALVVTTGGGPADNPYE
jgi:hypothetical protein